MTSRRRARFVARALGLLALGTGLSACAAAGNAAKLVLAGDSRVLRERPEGSPQRSVRLPPLLLIALDGVDRALVYQMLRAGELPGLAGLLSGEGKDFPHTHFDETLSATLPSSTMSGWATVLTGVGPAEHGMTGNEFFLRETRTFAAPIPTTFEDAAPTLACYTADEYCNRLLTAPTVYQRMRARDPDVLVWVAMHQIYAGADVLLLAERTAFARAFEGMLAGAVKKMADGQAKRDVYAKLDREIVNVLIDELEEPERVTPDVLTVYFSGTDLYGHIAHEGPDHARRDYLREVLDPEIARMASVLRSRNMLVRRWVVLTSDHGHSEVKDDDAHALAMDGGDDPPRVLERASFRVRPFGMETAKDADFQAVLAYQGAMAFVYLADRSGCAQPKQQCVWSDPPRYQEDVLVAAEAFHAASVRGERVPEMKDKLDIVLTRKPRAHAERDLPLEVYVGEGRTVPVSEWLEANPRPEYLYLEARLRDLSEGRHGERAGDIVLVPVNGDRADPDARYYFAAPTYRSWHGSPGRKDSEVPLIVAHPGYSSAEIGAEVRRVLGATPRQQKVTDLLLALRYSTPPPR